MPLKECRDCGEPLRDTSFSAELPFLIGASGREPDGSDDLELEGSDLALLEPLVDFLEDGEPYEVEVPSVLGHRWRVLERRGQGTFGTFFLGEHSVLGMKVGIKVLRSRYTSTTAGRKAFHQEAMRVSRLHHPNIVRVFDHGEETVYDGEREEHVSFLIMEYLAGRPLHEHMADSDFGLDDLVEVIRQVAEALVVAHTETEDEEALVHLDLKPEHIFLERIQSRWHVKVIDFGIAEIVSARERSGPGSSSEGRPSIAGTLPYMAPERWQGTVDSRCDLYSLGVILYEGICGRKPFDVADPKVMRRLHEEEVPSPPSQHREGPRTRELAELDAIVLRLLEKSPDDRPASVEELVEALETWQARPRLSLGQRVARVVLVPMVALLFVVLLFFCYGPWDNVFVPSSARHIGPNKELPIEATITRGAFGYDGGTASLRIEGYGRSVELDLGEVSGDQVKATLTWEELRGAFEEEFEEELDDGDYTASIHVRDWPWRSVVSEPFGITLDSKQPVPEIVGDAETDGQLWLQRNSLDVCVNEDALVDQCRLNENQIAKRLSDAGGTTLRFTVPEGAEEIRVEVVDRAGNVGRLRKPIKWRRTLELETRRKHYTNEDEYTLHFKVAGAGRTPIVLDGDTELQVTGSEGDYQCTVTFDDVEDDREQLKTLRIRAWSEYSVVTRRSDPDTEETVEVRFLRRDIKIKSQGGERGQDRLPERFEFMHGAEPVQDVGWQVRMTWSEGSEDLVIDDSGPLTVPAVIDKGVVHLEVVAWDPYGNSGRWKETYFLGVGPARVAFSLQDEDGRAVRSLLHKDCPLAGGQLGFLYAKVAWDRELNGEPALQFHLGDRKKTLLVDHHDGRYRIPYDQLFSSLKSGQNEIHLTATSTTYPGRTGSDSQSLFYEDPLELDFSPNPPEVTKDKITIRVRVTSGPKGIKVSDDWTREKTNGDDQTFSRTVEVHRAGPTQVDFEVTLNGLTHKETHSFWQAPRDKQRYVFDCGEEVGPLRLEYFQPSSELQSFYYLPEEEWRELRKRFRDSKAGGHMIPASAPLPAGISWDEASGIVRWLNRTLRGKLGKDQKFELPTARQLNELADARRLPGREAWEWLTNRLAGSPDGTRILGQAVSRRRIRAFRNEVQEDFMFRVVLPAKTADGRFHPRFAKTSESVALKGR